MREGSAVSILTKAFEEAGFSPVICHGEGAYDFPEAVTPQQAATMYTKVVAAIKNIPALSHEKENVLKTLRAVKKQKQPFGYHPLAFSFVLTMSECEDAEKKNGEDRAYLRGLFEEAQQTYKTRWEAIEKTAALLSELGFKDGVNVQSDYNLGIEENYPISWVVNEAIYLATGHGTIGDLNGGVQNGDWHDDKEADMKAGLKWILTNARLQTAVLDREQTRLVKESFEKAYRQHVVFRKPMSGIYNFIHDRTGCFHEASDDLRDEVYDFLWEVRHGDPKSIGGDVQEFMELTDKIALAKQASKKKKVVEFKN
jgi:hypothetical protein